LGTQETPWLTVAGVGGDIREESLAEPSQRPSVYLPYAQSLRSWYFNPRDLAIRTPDDPLRLAEAVRRQVWELDPEQTVSNVRTMTEVVDRQLAGHRTPAMLLASFSALALLLAALGVYGLLAFVVAGRRSEFGLRLALGASRASIIALVVRRSLLWVSAGCAAGVASSLASGRLLANLLFGVSPHDPATLIGATLLLIAVGVAASCVPALRAMRVEPIAALRYE
jgi:putative ABC transport system permease protein